MDKKKISTTSALTILWIVSMAIAYICYFIEFINKGLNGGTNTIGESIIPFLLMMFYFFPLLLLINKFAKLEKKEKILRVTRILVPFFGLFTIIGICIAIFGALL